MDVYGRFVQEHRQMLERLQDRWRGIPCASTEAECIVLS